MLLFLVTSISFIFLVKTLFPRPIPPWVSDTRYLPLCFWKGLSFSLSSVIKEALSARSFQFVPQFLMEQRIPSKRLVTLEENEQPALLDLPELALECILEKLPPAGLCTMAGVCSSLRERCTSDYLWERHMKQKWGSILSPAAYREWQWFMASKMNSDASERLGHQGLIKLICQVWPFSRFRSEFNRENAEHKSFLSVDSIMSWYMALETGKFWFPAQVYNREHGHVGFVLSCYDAELSYDAQTDTFQARYPPHGRRAAAIENGVDWQRLRAPPVDTSPHELHISDCLSDLHPGDNIEIQWRRNKEFPYGWWYGLVGHLESCDGNETYCQCHNSSKFIS